MAIVVMGGLRTQDPQLDGCLAMIRAAKHARDIREYIATAMDRCYALGVNRAGYPRNGMTHNHVLEHINRVRNAVYGEEVRDAICMGLEVCYNARGVILTSDEQENFRNLREATTGEELKNGILRSLSRCGKDVK